MKLRECFTLEWFTRNGYRCRVIGLALLGASAVLHGQTIPRRASVIGDGQATEGKCTIEVEVDGVAEVEIDRDMALLRNLSGDRPQWRRFQCDAIMPVIPLNFRFQGIDGRGKQVLERNPSGGGPAIIKIEDSGRGSEGYTFDIMWKGARDPRGGLPGPGSGGGFGGSVGGDRDSDRRGGVNRAYDESMRSCEDAVIDDALDKLRPQVIVIRRTALDDGPGRADWVVGVFEARQGRNWDRYRFECNMNFSTGRARSVNFTSAGRR